MLFLGFIYRNVHLSKRFKVARLRKCSDLKKHIPK
jgi:hypothetical protein